MFDFSNPLFVSILVMIVALIIFFAVFGKVRAYRVEKKELPYKLSIPLGCGLAGMLVGVKSFVQIVSPETHALVAILIGAAVFIIMYTFTFPDKRKKKKKKKETESNEQEK